MEIVRFSLKLLRNMSKINPIRAPLTLKPHLGSYFYFYFLFFKLKTNQSRAVMCQWSPQTVQNPTKLASCRREGRGGFIKNCGGVNHAHLRGGVNHALSM